MCLGLRSYRWLVLEELQEQPRSLARLFPWSSNRKGRICPPLHAIGKIMANELPLEGAPNSSYIDEVVGCSTCHGLDIDRTIAKSHTVFVPYGWGGRYLTWQAAKNDLEISRDRSCQICSVVCELQSRLEERNDGMRAAEEWHVDFVIPQDNKGYCLLNYRWKGEGGDFELSVQLGLTSFCKY